MKAHRLLPALLALLRTGCASKHPTVSAWRGTGFNPARTDKIALTLRPNPSPEDAELGRLLIAELKREGFSLVPRSETDYTLAYAMEADSTETDMPQHDFAVSSTPQTTRDILTSATPAPPGFTRAPPGYSPSLGPTVVVYHNKGIRLYFYSNPMTHPGGLQIAWSGCIEAGERFSAEREPLLIEKLLGYFGQDYHGTANLDK
jgi:hypothetical protein